MRTSITNDFCLLIHWRNPFIASAGTEKYIQLQVETLKQNNIDSITIFPVKKKLGITIFGWGIIENRQFIGVYDEAKIKQLLYDALNMHSCKGVFVHHLMWSNLDSLQRILSFTPEIIFYVHDYYSCCEQQNLLKNDDYYCGGGSINYEKCRDCKYYDKAIEKKKATKKFFDSFQNMTVIAPSEIAAKIWIEGYPEYRERVQIIEHLKVKETVGTRKHPERGKLNVAFVGTGTKSKGWDIWIEAIRNLPEDVKNQYNFYHMGYTPENFSFIKHVPVSIAEDGANAMIDALIKYDIDVAMLLSIWPETYCYTFYESLLSGCYVVTTDCSGNIQKQVQAYTNGTIINAEKSSLGLFLKNQPVMCQLVNEYKKNNSRDYDISYSNDYLRLIKTIPITKRFAKANRVNRAFIANILYCLRYKKQL